MVRMDPSRELAFADVEVVMSRQRVLLSCSIGFVVLFAAATAVLGTPPGINDSGADIVKWMTAHHDAVRWSVWLATLSVPIFVIYAVLMREVLGGVVGRVFLFGASAVAVLTVAQSWITAAVARRPTEIDPATARTLLDVAAYWGPTLTGFTILTLGAIAVGAVHGGALPRWVGYVAAIVLVEQLVETITIVGTSGFWGAGGPMNTILGAGLTVMAWLVAGIAASRRPIGAGQVGLTVSSTA
ncbi:hypothetical protein BH10ACT2_BH10ACT2_06050 [soil metagenome]